MSDPVLLAIIGVFTLVINAIIGVVGLLIKDNLDRKREEAKIAREEKRDAEAKKSTGKLAEVIRSDISEVHTLVNGLTKKRVDDAGKAGEQKGAEDERDRQVIRDHKSPP